MPARLGLPALRQYPLVKVPNNQSDNQYPVYRWQNFAAQRIVARFLTLDAWWNHRVQSARYSGIPVGNIGDDVPCDMMDMLFARALHKAKFLLWASPGPVPDLGGKELDEHHSTEFAKSTRICNPGSYHHVCVEFSLRNLATNTLVNAASITSIEGSEAFSSEVIESGSGSGSGGGDGAAADDAASKLLRGRTALDDSALCAKQFKMLRMLVCRWLTDVTKSNDNNADTLLMNVYRWVSSPASNLYEPALHSMLLSLMQKVFMQLLAELRSLGSEVVYADFTRIIIKTRKVDVADAASYAKYVTDTIHNKELFKWLDLSPNRFWGHLIFMDHENFGGVDRTEAAVASRDNPPSLGSQVDEDDLRLTMHWNLSNYLTPHALECFEVLVARFLEAPYLYVDLKSNCVELLTRFFLGCDLLC